MTAKETYLKGCFVLTPQVFEDERGYFFESFNKETFKRLTSLNMSFVQDNQSKSNKGVLRGLHFQIGDHAQAKLVRVLQGRVLDVCVDLRPDSPTFKQHFSIELSAKNRKQLFVPRGFAHGFVVLEDATIFSYKCDNYYNKTSERGIKYDDKSLNIDWRLSSEDIVLSDKDTHLPTLESYLQ
ncbi:dTDP-4-dehydrorhamnose 3,5-epimerase [Mangrovimonas spongiae]|uniref:dTDP-4-dehydrorhamnose 3,5-epimerase n=1 Tax=Mangrovimonas spongiae TaxID=2494697 RepID=A0A3R9UWE3_9FLAO|nr:dTDP-4-dehydrorhamnose 3,5-epimerase [Mangrovimonas spongiae]RSK41524.1 dTDP-4-dehydrorhamnose 3,5-epimerase [Mangrovimonas spongiae]